MFACRAYHYWDRDTPLARQHIAKWHVDTPLPWLSAAPSIGHDTVKRPFDNYDEPLIYNWLETELLPSLAKRPQVSDEEWALLLVANVHPGIDGLAGTTWFSYRWEPYTLSGLLLLLAASIEVQKIPSVPEICIKHVKLWRDWARSQPWVIPNWLPSGLLSNTSLSNIDVDGLTELALALHRASGPCLAAGVDGIRSSPLWDTLSILRHGDATGWPNMRRVTWWMDEHRWVIRIAHAGPSDNSARNLTGYGTVYMVNPCAAEIEWREWAMSNALTYQSTTTISKESLAFGVVKAKFEKDSFSLLLVRLYQWWLREKETAPITLLSLLTGLATEKIASTLTILESIDESDCQAIAAAFKPSSPVSLPEVITE